MSAVPTCSAACGVAYPGQRTEACSAAFAWSGTGLSTKRKCFARRADRSYRVITRAKRSGEQPDPDGKAGAASGLLASLGLGLGVLLGNNPPAVATFTPHEREVDEVVRVRTGKSLPELLNAPSLDKSDSTKEMILADMMQDFARELEYEKTQREALESKLGSLSQSPQLVAETAELRDDDSGVNLSAVALGVLLAGGAASVADTKEKEEILRDIKEKTEGAQEAAEQKIEEARLTLARWQVIEYALKLKEELVTVASEQRDAVMGSLLRGAESAMTGPAFAGAAAGAGGAMSGWNRPLAAQAMSGGSGSSGGSGGGGGQGGGGEGERQAVSRESYEKVAKAVEEGGESVMVEINGERMDLRKAMAELKEETREMAVIIQELADYAVSDQGRVVADLQKERAARSALEEEIARAQAELDRCRSEVSSLKGKSGSLGGDYDGLQEELKALRTAKERTEERMQNLVARASEAEKRAAEYGKELMALRQGIVPKAAATTTAAPQEGTAQFDPERFQLLRELRSVRTEKDSLGERVDELRTRYSNAELRARKYSQELQEEREARDEANARTERLEKEVQQVMTDASMERLQLLRELREVRGSETEARTRLDDLLTRMGNAEMRAQKYSKELQRERGDKEGAIQDAIRLKESVQKTLLASSAEKFQLQRDMRGVLDRATKAEGRVDELSTRFRNAEMRAQKYSRELQAEREARDQAIAAVKAMQAEMDTSLAKANGERFRMQRELREVLSRAAKAEKRVDELGTRFGNAELRAQKYSHEVQSARGAEEQLKETISKLEKDMQRSENEARAERFRLQRDLREILSRATDAEGRLDDISTRMGNAELRAQKYSQDLSKSQAAHEGALSKIKSMQGAMEKQAAEASKERFVLQRQLRDARTDSSKLAGRLDDVSTRMGNAELRAQKYSSELQSERSARDAANEAVAQIQKEMETSALQASRERFQLQRELREVKTEKDSTARRLDDLSTRMGNAELRAVKYSQDLQGERGAREEALQALSAARSEVEQNSREASKERFLLQRQLRDQMSRAVSAETRLDDVATRMSNSEMRAQKYSHDLQSEREAREAAIQAAAKTEADMKKAVWDASKERFQIQRELRDVKTEKVKVEERLEDVSTRMGNAELRAQKYSKDVQKSQAAHESALALVAKLQEEIKGIGRQASEERFQLMRDLRDVRADKNKAESRVDDIAQRMSNAELRAQKYSRDLQTALAAEEAALQAVQRIEEEMRLGAADASKERFLLQRQLRDERSERTKVEGRLEDLSTRMGNAELRAQKYSGELQGERAAREEALVAVSELEAEIRSNALEASKERFQLQRELRDERTEKSKIAARLEDLATRMGNAELRAQKYSKDVQAAQGAEEAAQSAVARLQQEVVKTQKEASQEKFGLMRTLRDVRTEKTAAEGRVEDLSTRMSNAELRAQKYSLELQLERSARAHDQEEIAGLEARIDRDAKEASQQRFSLMRELRDVRTDKAKAESRVEDLSERMGNAELRAQKYSKDLQSAQEAKEDALATVLAKQVEIENISRAASAERFQLMRDLRDVRSGKTEAEGRLGELATRMGNAELRAQKYSKDLQAAQAAQEEAMLTVTAMQSRMDSIAKEANAERFQLMRQLRDVRMEKDKAETRVEDLATRMGNSELRAQKYSRDVQAAVAAHEDALTTVKKMEDEIQRNSKQANQEKFQLHRQLRDVRTEKDKAEGRLEDLMTRFGNAELRAQKYSAEVQQAKAAEDSAAEAVRGLKEEILRNARTANEEKFQLHRQLRDVRTEKDKAEGRLDDLATRMGNAELRAQKYSKDLVAAEGAKEDARMEVQSLQLQIVANEKQSSAVRFQMHRQLRDVKTEKDEMASRLSDVMSRMGNAELRAQKYSKDLQSAQEAKEDALATVLAKQAEIENISRAASAERFQLMRDLRDVRSGKTEAEGRLGELATRMGNAELRAQKYSKDLQAAQAAQEEAMLTVTAMQSRMDSIAKEANAEKFQLMRQLRDVRTEKDKAETRVEDLATRMGNSELRAQKYSKDLQAAVDEKEDAIATIGRMDKEMQRISWEANKEKFQLQRQLRGVRTEKDKAENRVEDLSVRFGNAELRAQKYSHEMQAAKAAQEGAMVAVSNLQQEIQRNLQEASRERFQLMRQLRDVRSEKSDAEVRLDELSTRMGNAELRAQKYSKDLQMAQVAQQDALETVSKMQREIDAIGKMASAERFQLHRELREVRTERAEAEGRLGDLATRMGNAELRAQKYSRDLQAAQEAKEEAMQVVASQQKEIDNIARMANAERFELMRKLRDVRTEKTKAEDRVEDLSTRMGNAELRAQKYSGDLQAALASQEDAMTTIMKMQQDMDRGAKKANEDKFQLMRELRHVRSDKTKAEKRVDELATRFGNAELRAQRYSLEVQMAKAAQADAEEAVLGLQQDLQRTGREFSEERFRLMRDLRDVRADKNQSESRLDDIASRMRNAELRAQKYSKDLQAALAAQEAAMAIVAEKDVEMNAISRSASEDRFRLQRELRAVKDEKSEAQGRLGDLATRFGNAELRAQKYSKDLQKAKDAQEAAMQTVVNLQGEILDIGKKADAERFQLQRQLRDVRSEKSKAEGRVEDLSTRFGNAELRAQKYSKDVQGEREARERALSALRSLEIEMEENARKASAERFQMQRDMRDIRAEKAEVEDMVENLGTRFNNAEMRAQKYSKDLQVVALAKENAARAVQTLKEEIEMRAMDANKQRFTLLRKLDGTDNTSLTVRQLKEALEVNAMNANKERFSLLRRMDGMEQTAGTARKLQEGIERKAMEANKERFFLLQSMREVEAQQDDAAATDTTLSSDEYSSGNAADATVERLQQEIEKKSSKYDSELAKLREELLAVKLEKEQAENRVDELSDRLGIAEQQLEEIMELIKSDALPSSKQNTIRYEEY